MVILEKLGEQKVILSLLNESEDPLSNNKIIKISIPLIDFNKDEYESLSIFIYQYPNILALIEMNESDINKKFINLKQRFTWIFQNILQSPNINKWLKVMQREYNSIIKNKIYILVNLPKGKKAMKDKWIFNMKITKLNELNDSEFKFQIIFKSRWVAKDFL
jgi:hypothetical protein